MTPKVVLPARVRGALMPMPGGYAELLRSVVALLSARAEVRALWVSGSVGREAADAGSDLDLVVTVADDAFDALSDRAVWAPLDPLLCLSLPFLPGAAVITTREGLRLDVVLERVADLRTTPYRQRLAILDRDGLELPPLQPGRGPDPAVMSDLVVEFLRQSAIFPAAVLAREDWLLGQESVASYRTLLYRIFLESNQPQPPMGVKQWSSRLTSQQREVLIALGLPSPNRESIVADMVRARRAIRTQGRAAIERVGGSWPVDLDEAMSALWKDAGLSD